MTQPTPDPQPPVPPGPPVRELVLTRLIAAPRALVFRAWTDPRHVAQWWGPDGFTIPVCELDVRPGGALRIDMRGPDGVDYPMTGVFQEVVPPERLVFRTAALPNEAGQAGLEGVTTVTLAEQGGQTLLTVHTAIVRAGPGAETALAGMEPGWNQTLDHLAAYAGSLKGDSMIGDTNNTTLPAVPDMKLELVPVPVTDVDRAKAFYVEKAGFKLEVDVRPNDTMRVVQLTPPGSACSIVFGTGMGDITAMAPGSVKGLHLVVADIRAAREALVARGLDVGEISDLQGVKYAGFSDPDGNSWLLQEFPADLKRIP